MKDRQSLQGEQREQEQRRRRRRAHQEHQERQWHRCFAAAAAAALACCYGCMYVTELKHDVCYMWLLLRLQRRTYERGQVRVCHRISSSKLDTLMVYVAH
jgi:hypothetical protein